MPPHTVHIKLTVAGQEIEGAVPLPAGKLPPRALLPVLQQLTNTIVSLAEQIEAASGRTVSCRAGCGACCRQMVPISPAEAHALSDVVARLPASKRKAVEARFSAAHEKLKRAGLMEKLVNRHTLTPAEQAALDQAYFSQQIACPFLETESCSIHPDRPLACREYLVTSPPKHCASPTADRVKQVDVPAKISSALTRACATAKVPYPWVPLILALDFARTNREQASHEGPALLQRILSDL